MAVPLLDIARQNKPLENEFKAAFDRVFSSNAFILGPEVAAFEREIAETTGIPHAIGLSSGTDALLIAMMAMDIGPGDEVLCPAFTFFGTAGSIARVGATPVWVDVLEDTYNIDFDDAARKTGPDTKAIIPVHLFGQPCDIDRLNAFASQYDLRIIEDVAQALGATFDDQPAGGFGDCGAVSFYPTKNIGGFGDAGLLLTRNDELAEKVLTLRNHGMEPKYYHSLIGGNFRLDALQAALLRVKLQYLNSYTEKRAANAQFYTENLKGHGLIVTPATLDSAHHVWNQYTIRVIDGKRAALREHLAARQIGSEIYYPLSLHEQVCFRKTVKGADSIRVSSQLANQVLSIPVFPEMTEAERDEVLQALWDFGYN